MMAKGEMSIQQFFAALYGHADIAAEPQLEPTNGCSLFNTIT